MAEKMKRLPDAELEVMKVLWDNPPPMSTNDVMKVISEEKTWNISTLLTLLSRLIDRGFLASEKRGRERIYSPIVDKDIYTAFETRSFLQKLHKNSLVNLVSTLYNDDNLSSEDIEALSMWLTKVKGANN